MKLNDPQRTGVLIKARIGQYLNNVQQANHFQEENSIDNTLNSDISSFTDANRYTPEGGTSLSDSTFKSVNTIDIPVQGGDESVICAEDQLVTQSLKDSHQSSYNKRAPSLPSISSIQARIIDPRENLRDSLSPVKTRSHNTLFFADNDSPGPSTLKRVPHNTAQPSRITPQHRYGQSDGASRSRSSFDITDSTTSNNFPKSILKQPSPSIQPEDSSIRGRPPVQRYDRMSDLTSYESHGGSSAELDMMAEEERFRVFHENLRKHRQRSFTPQQRYPQTSFNGPFFKLQEVTPNNRIRSQSVAPLLPVHEASDESTRFYSPSYDRQDYNQQSNSGNMRMLSTSESELAHNQGVDRTSQFEARNSGDNAVFWPPRKDTVRPSSVMAKNIADPERIDEYRRQKQMEEESVRRRHEEAMRYHQKQLNAIERLYSMEGRNSVQTVDSLSPAFEMTQHRGVNNSTVTPSIDSQEAILSETPQQVRVFETRPMSVLTESTDPTDFLVSPSVGTWKRTYVVEPAQGVAKNEILTSEELLEKERFELDLLKRREAFIEKPESKPDIFRTGRRWQPPPDQPYIWPTMRRAVSVQPLPQSSSFDFSPGVPRSANEIEHNWEPYVYDPTFKREHKNFTPVHSPRLSPVRGMGTGSLDEAAKRQTRYLITPTADGSHRPKPAFGGPRSTPSGGFYPHAPNAIKIVKKKQSHTARTPSPRLSIDREGNQVEVIHERNYHTLGDGDSLSRSYESIPHTTHGRAAAHHQHVEDWEKIYDLPPHSSTVVIKDVPSNVDVKRRLAHFETLPPLSGRAMRRNSRDDDAYPKHLTDRRVRTSSVDHRRSEESEHRRTPLQRVPRHDFNIDPNGRDRQRSRAGGGPSVQLSDTPVVRHPHTLPVRHTDTPSLAHHSSSSMTLHRDGDAHRNQRSGIVASAGRRNNNNNVNNNNYNVNNTDMQTGQQAQRTTQRRLHRVPQATTPSSAPLSYERTPAPKFFPPPPPPGYKRPPSPPSGYHAPPSSASRSREYNERPRRSSGVSRSSNATPQKLTLPPLGVNTGHGGSMMGSTRSIPISIHTPYTPVSSNSRQMF